MALAQLNLFVEPWPVVVPSGSCGGMMRSHTRTFLRQTLSCLCGSERGVL